ncbi:MAG: Osmosensitive K+ channel histidine kinase KdpD [uncultured Nocardioidaceae bacterium]|uniref:Signal transduction histidine-protein kinase/phosphatase MprB n=1 Tax=uncultured Nocardioidaceae bacterium TaxID=253824 RepID=A0A6J4MVJ4_9ACTN|nr:MAG: Osmosensitive K+ channel histidine kinase KdpD [uncultured Nocardioidaceae bacterium]
MSSPLLDQVTSVKLKLGLLVAVSVTIASVVASIGNGGGVPFWLSLPVTVALALGVTQLLATGMTSPLREMTAAARRMARGDYSGRVTATSNDEVGELARAFNRMAQDLAAVDRQRRELVANVSHELRTPLAALCAVLENLVDGVAEPDPVALRAALDQAERLSALANDLLDLARVDAGKAPLSTRQVDVQELLDRAVAEATVTGREVRYDVAVTPRGLTVHADPARLHQLVANLLDNASRHSPAGGLVRLTADDTGSGWRLEVADEGPGVAAADRDRVFERFGTLTDADGGGGTGLGLAIARWVTDLHGGTIHFVDPEPARAGACVRVELPREPRHTSSSDVTSTPVRSAAAASSVTPRLGQPVAPVPPAPAWEQQPALDTLFGRLWPDGGVPGDVRAVLCSVAVGLLAGIVLPFRDGGLGMFLVLLAAGGVLLAFSRHRTSAYTLACAALCALLAATVVVRDADWIVFLCVLVGGVVALAALVHGRTLPSFVLAGIAWPLSALRGLPWLGRSMRGVSGRGNSAAALRTVVWSALALVVFGLLFASADAVFAEWAGAVVPDLQLDTFVLRAFIAVAVGGMVLAGTYLAINPPRIDGAAAPVRPVAHRFEWLAPVLLVDAVFVVFLLAQATVIFGGHDYLERTTGLTYAEYVHQGFGQLTLATALTLLVVWAAARKAPRVTSSDRGWLRSALGLLCVLTLVVVASALYRMHVYQEAYGFTQLRLLVDVFEGWLGLLVLGVLAAGVTLRAAWLPRAALLSGAVLLLGLAAINPDAWVAQHNVDRYESTGKIDLAYLRSLSADAVPVLESLPADLGRCVLAEREPNDDDWLEWNFGRHRAEPVLRESAVDQEYDAARCADLSVD